MKRAMLAAALTAAGLWIGPAQMAQADPDARVSVEAFKKADLNGDGKIDLHEAVRAGWVAAPGGPPPGPAPGAPGPEPRREAGPPPRPQPPAPGPEPRREPGPPRPSEERGRFAHRFAEQVREHPELFRKFVASLNPDQQELFMGLVPPELRDRVAEDLRQANRMRLLASLNPMQRQLLLLSSTPAERERLSEAIRQIDSRRKDLTAGRWGQAGRRGMRPWAGRWAGRWGAAWDGPPAECPRGFVCPLGRRGRPGADVPRGEGAPRAPREPGAGGPPAARPEGAGPERPFDERLGRRMLEALRDQCRHMIREEVERALREAKGRFKLQSHQDDVPPPAAIEGADDDIEMLRHLDVLSDLQWLGPVLEEDLSREPAPGF